MDPTAEARAAEQSREAAEAVERAEREPLLGHRLAPVRAAVDAAAPLLDRVAAPELRARLLLRLAQLKMVENDWEGADQALEAVGRHVPDDTILRFLTGIRACRVAIRRGPEPRKLAQSTLLAAAERLPSFDTGAGWAGVTTEVALAIAELALHDDPPDASAFEPLAAIVDELAANRRESDTVFAGHQLLAAYALSIGELERAIRSLRTLVAIARDVGSPADEIEARIAVASALVASGDPIALEEATRHVQIARDRALEHELPELHQAALLAQAAVMSYAGKTAGAIDRALELARVAAAKQDVQQYVAAVGIMAELYARTGDHVSAFRTIVEAHRALSTATGGDTIELFRPLLGRLRDRIGAERLDRISADVDQANRLADQIAHQKPSKPS